MCARMWPRRPKVMDESLVGKAEKSEKWAEMPERRQRRTQKRKQAKVGLDGRNVSFSLDHLWTLWSWSEYLSPPSALPFSLCWARFRCCARFLFVTDDALIFAVAVSERARAHQQVRYGMGSFKSKPPPARFPASARPNNVSAEKFGIFFVRN